MTTPEHDDPEDRADALLVGIAKIGAQMGFDPERLVADLTGDSELGKFCRALLDIRSPDTPEKRRGRPPNDAANWLLMQIIDIGRQNGKTLDAVVAEYVERVGGNHESVIRRYKRLSKVWPNRPTITSVADLYSGPPESSR